MRAQARSRTDWMAVRLLAASLLLAPLSLALAQSPHQLDPADWQAEPTEDILDAAARAKAADVSPDKRATPAVASDFISLGYVQNNDIRFHIRWNALTHVAVPFTVFDADGNFTNLTSSWNNRPAEYQAGGAAARAGTKVLMTLNSFDDGPGGAIEQVFQSPAKRANLVANVASALKNDPGNYNAGVNVDIEFSWNATTRDGITAFFQELRAAFDADPALQNKEISVYTHPTYNALLWNFDATTGITPHIDYMVYSGYDFGTGNAPRAVSDQDNLLVQARNYMNAGLPPEKLVIAYSTYGRTWNNVTAYGVNSGAAGSTGRGLTDGVYDTTINPSGPYTEQFQATDVTSWYTFNDGIDRVVVFDSPRSLHEKVRTALSYPLVTSGEAYQGRRIRGVAFWSLMWLAETTSRDPRTGGGTNVSRTRTYPHLYQTLVEALKAPGQEWMVLDGFEGTDPRWRDPDQSPDTVGSVPATTVAPVLGTVPPGPGAPESSGASLRQVIGFTGAGTKRAVVAHEVLSSPIAGTLADTNAFVGIVPLGSELTAKVRPDGSVPAGTTVRLMVVDANRQIELGPPTTLTANTWSDVSFHLADPSQATAFTTAEPGFLSGNGVVDSNGFNVFNLGRDIGVFGFLVETTGTGTVTLLFDELAYRHRQRPATTDYRINEFSYAGSAGEFIEISGPAGVIPAGVELRVFDSTAAAVLTVDLAGLVVPASGLVVVGDSDVANVASSTGFGPGTNELPNTGPVGIALLDTQTGGTIDGVVYGAMGQLAGLTRPEARRVADFGSPWIGQIAGAHYTAGRYPDGADTRVNNRDFSMMRPTPGQPNGSPLTLPVTYNFDTLPSSAFLTFPFASAGSVASAVGASPSGGNVLRVADSSGGQMMYIGDASLGSDNAGYRVTGEIYVHASGARAQVIGVGIAGAHGSNFFTDNPAASGYESGYWLLYANKGTATLPATGLPNFAGSFKFVHATHDNQDATPVVELGTATLAALGVTPGSWATFEMSINPGGNQLVAKVNDTVVYTGAIPAGGPTRGAVVVGHRETDTGGNVAADGTWLDNLVIAPLTIPDTEAPTSSLDAVAQAEIVGTSADLTFTSADTGGSGVASVALFVRTPGAGSFVNSGLTPSGNTFTYTFAQSGLYEFYTVATDGAGNVESAPGTPDVTMVVNTTPNGALTLPFSSIAPTRTFPMESGLEVAITFNNVLSPGTLTVSRATNASGASAAGLATDRLLDQSWSLSAAGGLTFDNATIAFRYNPALIGGSVAESQLNTVFRVNGTVVTVYTGPSVTFDTANDLVTVTGVTGFSDWYIGNDTADVDTWREIGQ